MADTTAGAMSWSQPNQGGEAMPTPTLSRRRALLAGGAVASRRRILDMAAAERSPATGYHMPFPAIGFVERTADSFRWVSASYQLML
jgi:hypothetical protein